jgi:hypothetical protein
MEGIGFAFVCVCVCVCVCVWNVAPWFNVKTLMSGGEYKDFGKNVMTLE